MPDTVSETRQVVIVGGGPAGQATALQLADLGIASTVIDEQPRPGGQILRAPPPQIAVTNWMTDPIYAAAISRLRRFENEPQITWQGGTSVLGLAPRSEGGLALTLSDLDGVSTLNADKVLVASGCQDLAVPLPGWTLPGVYAAGGIQAFLKAQQVVPGARFVLAGTHPLQLLIAAQIVAAGGEVAAVLFAQERRAMALPLARSPGLSLGNRPALAQGAQAMALLRSNKVPVHFGCGLEAVLGTTHVEAVRTSRGEIACDTLGLCYGFVPQSTLTRMAGARVAPAGPAGGWATVHDEALRTSVPDLYIAGETGGVAGAEAAASRGTLAAITIAADLGQLTHDAARTRTEPARRALASHRRFAALLDRIADPRPHFPALEDETLVCRCEDVTLAQLAPHLEGRSANGVKLLSRCGMGACQGRNCEPTLLRLCGEREDPGFSARFPARPVRIGDLAGSR